MPRHQRIGEAQEQVVDVVALLDAELEHVAEAARRQQPEPRAASFDQRVGDQRRAMQQLAHVGDRNAGCRADAANTVERAVGRILRRGQALVQRDSARRRIEQHEIGEGAADVEAEPIACGRWIDSHGFHLRTKAENTTSRKSYAAAGELRQGGRGLQLQFDAFALTLSGLRARGKIRGDESEEIMLLSPARAGLSHVTFFAFLRLRGKVAQRAGRGSYDRYSEPSSDTNTKPPHPALRATFPRRASEGALTGEGMNAAATWHMR